MFWNKNISNTEYWFIAAFLIIYLIYFIKIIYISFKLKISARASFLKFLPRGLTFALLISAILEPSFGNFEDSSQSNISNKLIYFLVDVSKSMDSEDIAPSRIEKVKNEIRKIVNFFPNERFGIVAFASEPILHTPLTSDHDNLKIMINTLNTQYLQSKGTNLADALRFCIDKISITKTIAQSTSAIILFTDGEDFSELNDNILNDFRRRRINIFIVGIGTTKGSKIPIDGQQFVKNKYQEPIVSKLEASYLKTIASKTQGKYFEYNATNSPLNSIISNIENLKGISSLQSLDAANPGNKYHYPLMIAILLVCFDLLFTIRIFSF